jgi:hypothetical protein
MICWWVFWKRRSKSIVRCFSGIHRERLESHGKSRSCQWQSDRIQNTTSHIKVRWVNSFFIYSLVLVLHNILEQGTQMHNTTTTTISSTTTTTNTNNNNNNNNVIISSLFILAVRKRKYADRLRFDITQYTWMLLYCSAEGRNIYNRGPLRHEWFGEVPKVFFTAILKIQFILEQAIKAQKGIRGIALIFLWPRH